MNEIKKEKKKRMAIISILVLILFIIAVGVIYKFFFSKQARIDYLLKYRETHTLSQTHDKLDSMYQNPSQEKFDIYNVVFADEIENNKRAMEKVKEQEKENEDAKKVSIENVKQKKNSNDMEFTIVNPTNREISYMEIGIDYMDKNETKITSDWTNETNIQANSKRLKDFSMYGAPSNARNVSMYVTKVMFEN